MIAYCTVPSYQAPPVIIIGHRLQHLCCSTQGTVQIYLGFTFCLSVFPVLRNALLLNKAPMIVSLRTLYPLYSLTLIVVRIKRISSYKSLPFTSLMITNDNYRLWGGRGILGRVRYVLFCAVFLAYSWRKADRTSVLLSSFTAAPSISRGVDSQVSPKLNIAIDYIAPSKSSKADAFY